MSDFTGNIQSAGVEKQPGVEHSRRKARRPLVPPTTSIWLPEITFLQMLEELVIERVPYSAFIEPSQSHELIFSARSDRLRRRKHAGDSGKLRRNLQAESGHAIEGRKRGSSCLVQDGARHFAAKDIYVRAHTNLTDDAIRRLADCTVTHNKTR